MKHLSVMTQKRKTVIHESDNFFAKALKINLNDEMDKTENVNPLAFLFKNKLKLAETENE